MNAPTKRRESPACAHCGEPAVTIHGVLVVESCDECGRPLQPDQQEAAARIDEACNFETLNSDDKPVRYVVRWDVGVGTVCIWGHPMAEPLPIGLVYPSCCHAHLVTGAHTSLIERLTQHGITVRIPGEEAGHVD